MHFYIRAFKGLKTTKCPNFLRGLLDDLTRIWQASSEENHFFSFYKDNEN